MSGQAYNGWEGNGTRASAYATWRVKLELCNADSFIHESFGKRPSLKQLADYLEDWIREIVRGKDYKEETLAVQYAMAFLDEVNYDEIAEHVLSGWPEDEEER